MGIFSGSFTAESGTVTVEIDGSTIIGGSGTFYIQDIGKLEFSNEIPNKDDSDVTSIITKQGGFQVSVRNTLSNGSSFISSLDELLPNEQLNAKLTVNGLDTFLALDYRNVNYDERTEIVKIDLRPRYVWPETSTGTATAIAGIEYPINTFYASYATADTLYPYGASGVVVASAVSMYEMSQDYLSWVYGINASDVLIATGVLAFSGLATTPTSPVAGDTAFVVPTSSTRGVLATLARFSALDAANFGHAFGKAFYTPRRYYTGSTGDFRVEVSYNNVTELSLNREKNNIYSIEAEYAAGQYAPSGTSIATGYNTLSKDSQTFSLRFSQAGFIDCEYYNTPNRFELSALLPNFRTGLMTSFAVESYASALGANGAKRISFKFRNALSLKPYQCFTLSSGAPSIFRASGASSVVYRPSRLYYDFKGDYVEGEAYAIAAV